MERKQESYEDEKDILLLSLVPFHFIKEKGVGVGWGGWAVWGGLGGVDTRVRQKQYIHVFTVAQGERRSTLVKQFS